MENKVITFRANEIDLHRIEDIKNLLKIINNTIPDEILTNSYILHLAIYTLKEKLSEEVNKNL